MRLRLLLPPLLVVLVAAGLYFWPRTGEKSAAGGAGTTASGTPAAAHGTPTKAAAAERPWHPEPVRRASIPRTEKVPAKVEAPTPVSLKTRIRHTPVKEILKNTGEVVKKGEVVMTLQPGQWEKERAAAEKAGDRERLAVALDALAQMEIKAEEDGLVHRIDARIGELPLFGKDGCLPLAVLFDWTKLSWKGTAPAALAPFLAAGGRVMVASGKDPPVAAMVVKKGEPGPDGGFLLEVRPTAPPPGIPEPGGEATIGVVTGTQEVLVIPMASVRNEGGRPVVQVVTVTGKLERREVVVGQPAPENRVEVSGVRMGESVAVWE